MNGLYCGSHTENDEPSGSVNPRRVSGCETVAYPMRSRQVVENLIFDVRSLVRDPNVGGCEHSCISGEYRSSVLKVSRSAWFKPKIDGKIFLDLQGILVFLVGLTKK